MTKWIITRGLGFSPGSVRFIPTMGFYIGIPPELSEAVYETDVGAQDRSRTIPADDRTRIILK